MNYPIVKELLARIGARLSSGALHQINGAVNYLHAGCWLQQHGYVVRHRCNDRTELYRELARGLTEPVTYLEFGVFEGASIREWSRLLSHPATVLHGFDSFEGLPENWGTIATRGAFDVSGRIPQIDDPRVKFYKGWFDRVLPGYLQSTPPKQPLVVHLDADIYSSTKYVLNELKPWLIAGTVLIFDEFYDREHELRALEEFIQETGIRLELLGVTRTLMQVAFRIV
jgi:hypothetical protein